MRILRSEVCQVSKGGNLGRHIDNFFFIINSVSWSDLKVLLILGLLIQDCIINIDVSHDSVTWRQYKVAIVARQQLDWCATRLSLPLV